VYVPVHALHLVNRYAGGSPESAPLHKLGTEQWAKARRRAAEAVRDVAAELLDLHARRHAHEPRAARNRSRVPGFANAFPFEETADQADAIAQVIADLARRPRWIVIICGDVGFGKPRCHARAGSLPCRPAIRSRYWFRPPFSAPTFIICRPSSALADQYIERDAWSEPVPLT